MPSIFEVPHRLTETGNRNHELGHRKRRDDAGPKYGASAYSSIRRYVRKNERACVVLVLDPPVVTDGVGFRATLRRVVPSPAFVQMVGDPVWPAMFTPDDELGDMVPLGKRRMSRPRTLSLSDRNGTDHECLAEAFATPYQVFILIHLRKALTKTTVILPPVVKHQTAYDSRSTSAV